MIVRKDVLQGQWQRSCSDFSGRQLDENNDRHLNWIGERKRGREMGKKLVAEGEEPKNQPTQPTQPAEEQ